MWDNRKEGALSKALSPSLSVRGESGTMNDRGQSYSLALQRELSLAREQQSGRSAISRVRKESAYVSQLELDRENTMLLSIGYERRAAAAKTKNISQGHSAIPEISDLTCTTTYSRTNRSWRTAYNDGIKLEDSTGFCLFCPVARRVSLKLCLRVDGLLVSTLQKKTPLSVLIAGGFETLCPRKVRPFGETFEGIGPEDSPLLWSAFATGRAQSVLDFLISSTLLGTYQKMT